MNYIRNGAEDHAKQNLILVKKKNRLSNLSCINEWRSRSCKTNDLLNQKRKIQCKKQIIFICINIMLLLPIRSFIKGRLSGSLSFVIKIINIEVWCKEKNAKI